MVLIFWIFVTAKHYCFSWTVIMPMRHRAYEDIPNAQELCSNWWISESVQFQRVRSSLFPSGNRFSCNSCSTGRISWWEGLYCFVWAPSNSAECPENTPSRLPFFKMQIQRPGSQFSKKPCLELSFGQWCSCNVDQQTSCRNLSPGNQSMSLKRTLIMFM